MSSPHRPSTPADVPPPDPPTEPDPRSLLAPIVTGLAEAHVGAEAATLVRIGLDDDDVALATRALPPGIHPSDALVGEVVPPRWAAAGVAAPATARHIGDDRSPTERVPVGIAVVVHRSGEVVHHLAGAEVPSVGDGPLDAPTGTLRDLLERSLGLPTAPPDQAPVSWFRRLWLDRLVTTAADRAVDEVPAPSPVGPSHPPTADRPHDFVRALVDDPRYGVIDGWGLLRGLAAGPPDGLERGPAAIRRTIAPFIDRSAAEWFDDGSFARCLTSALPEVDALLEAVDALLDPDTARAVRATFGPAAPDGE